MEELSDDELDVVYTQGAAPAASAIHRSQGFSLDDAFSDTDDTDVTFDFSPAALREELHKSIPRDDDWNHDIEGFTAKIGYSVDHETDASVSTFDINASVHDEPISPPMQQPPSPESQTFSHPSHSHPDSLNDVQLASEFSSVSLSDHSNPPDPEDELEKPKETVEEEHAYPAVQIEVHDDTAAQATVQEVSVPPPEPHTPQHYSTQSQDSTNAIQSLTPRSSASIASASSVSIPIPSSSSLPTPSSAQSTTSVASTSTRHRPTKSLGPSALDKVISKTRPHFLPPKPRTEDKKHMADWEKMMKQSRVAEEKRRKALQERRYAREQRIEQSLHMWEKEILPDWRVVHKNPALRKMWWHGIPTKLRATMWQSAVGNDLALSKDAFKACLARANRALAAGTFPTTVLGFIEDDINTTLPSLHLFTSGKGPLYQDLKDMLCAWVVARSDEGLGYVTGVAKIAAMLLINMAPAPGFLVMRNLLERHCMRSFYGGLSSKDDVEAYYRIFDTLLADGMPKIYFNFKQHQISPAAYLPDWLLSLFLEHLPFEACARIWDVLMLEGDSFLYRAALAVLGVLETRLFFPDKKELLELLKGENKAALEVARRDGRVLDGGKYEIYGVDEETLWERIDAMDEWWRESTWTRLIQRELPDL